MTKRLLLLGGLDPCGGAGITADAIVANLHGVASLPIALCLTVQNRHGFQRCHEVPAPVWREAFAAALADGPVHAVKVGLIGDVEGVQQVAMALRDLPPGIPIVIDPVLSATAGGFDAAPALAAAYREHLLPLASVFTPNQPEAERILGRDLDAALATGCAAILRKGGHGEGDQVTDLLVTQGRQRRFVRPRLAVGPVHGTGCALATALAAGLAQGLDLEAASGRAGDWLHRMLTMLGPADGSGLARPLPLAHAAHIGGTRQ